MKMVPKRKLRLKHIRLYQNRSIETAQVIEHLIDLAKEMREADARGHYTSGSSLETSSRL
jgi:hypothetical protein